jgi:hypothetical protein
LVKWLDFMTTSSELKSSDVDRIILELISRMFGEYPVPGSNYARPVHLRFRKWTSEFQIKNKHQIIDSVTNYHRTHFWEVVFRVRLVAVVYVSKISSLREYGSSVPNPFSFYIHNRP